MAVNWTRVASDDLNRHEAGKSGRAITQFRQTRLRILERLADLDDHPYMYPEVGEYSDPNIRELFEAPYRVIYKVIDNGVEVTGVFHHLQRLPV